MKTPTIIFFGTSEFSIVVLNTLLARGIKPSHIVTTPDRPQGRKLVLTPPPTKVWAQDNAVNVLQYEKLNDEAVAELTALQPTLFIVASYGKIIPQRVLDIPKKGCLNVHPSLLPKYRGASPLQSVILADDKHTGVTIIQMDAVMDHGPIIAQQQVTIDPWPQGFCALEQQLGIVGGTILADSIDGYIAGSIKPMAQDESMVTFTKKIVKEDGKLEINDNQTSSEQYANFLKIKAFEGWPGTYFFTKRKDKDIRVSIKEAEFVDGTLRLLCVTPEGGKEMKYEDFMHGL